MKSFPSPTYKRLCVNLGLLKQARESVGLDPRDRFHHLALLECAGLMPTAQFQRAIEAALKLLHEKRAD